MMSDKDPVQEQMRIKNDTEYLSQVRDMLSDRIREFDLERAQENRIVLAVDEAVTNIMEHGYEPNLEGWIDISITINEERVKIQIQDVGKRFDPNSVRQMDIVKVVEEGKDQGFGIYLIRQIMDEVRYRFEEGKKNKLTLIKRIT